MLFAIGCFTSVNAQSSKTKGKPGNVAVEETAYYCPMKCEGEKTYRKAGKCPECNMNLKAKVKDVAEVTYQCPMKCEGEKTYRKAGKCPECNMNLKVKVKDVAKVTYQCPMKCEGDKTYSKEGKCPKCNMALKKVNPGKAMKSSDGHNHQ